MVCIELKPDLTYEIDRRHKIVDFFIEDDYGVKHRCGQSFKLTETLIKKLLKELKSDFIMVSKKELCKMAKDEDEKPLVEKRDTGGLIREILRDDKK